VTRLYSLDRPLSGGQLDEQGVVFSTQALLRNALRGVLAWNGCMPISLDGTYKLERGKVVLLVLSTHTVRIPHLLTAFIGGAGV